MTNGNDAGVVIVGAGLGGIRVAENLRSGDYAGPITLIGAEDHPPYDRPPLSKSVLTGADDRVDLKPAEFFTDSDITLRTGLAVTAVDPDAHTVTAVPTDGGAPETLPYRTLVLATGLSPRPFPGVDGTPTGLHLLRTVDDAFALREALPDARNLVVIGGGFIGCEVAATVRTGIEGPSVTLVEPAPTPLAPALGETVGGLVARLHIEAGVRLHTGVGVAGITVTDGAVSGVRLDDGTELPADLVLSAIGSIPNTDLLNGSPLPLADRADGGGIACDATGRVLGVADVYAVGDVANWADAHGGRARVEHWNHTVEQAAMVAAELLDTDGVGAAVPYFWSDQYGLKIQMLGSPRPDDEVDVVEDDGRKFLAFYSRDGRITAVIGAGMIGKVMKSRNLVQDSAPVEEIRTPATP